MDAFNYSVTENWIHAIDPSEIKALIGRPLEDMIDLLLPNIRENVTVDIARTYREYYLTICGPRSPLFPGVKSALEKLSDNLLVCASTKITSLIEEVLIFHGIADKFNLIQGSEDIPKKPAPDLFLKILQLTGSDHNDTMAVGDTRFDVEAALRAGITPIGVLTGIGTGEDLREAGCQHIFPDIMSFAEFIESNVHLP